MCINSVGSAFTHGTTKIALSQTSSHRTKGNNALCFEGSSGLRQLFLECILMD